LPHQTTKVLSLFIGRNPQEQLPQANYQETLPNAANLALWAWDKEADSLHDFVPNYLKRVEAEENWLKNHTESGESYIKRL